MLVGVSWFSRELPLTPTISFRKGFLHSSEKTISKEGKNVARSQKVMEIPAIIFRNPNNTQTLASEQDTYAHNTLQKVIING